MSGISFPPTCHCLQCNATCISSFTPCWCGTYVHIQVQQNHIPPELVRQPLPRHLPTRNPYKTSGLKGNIHDPLKTKSGRDFLSGNSKGQFCLKWQPIVVWTKLGCIRTQLIHKFSKQHILWNRGERHGLVHTFPERLLWFGAKVGLLALDIFRSNCLSSPHPNFCSQGARLAAGRRPGFGCSGNHKPQRRHWDCGRGLCQPWAEGYDPHPGRQRQGNRPQIRRDSPERAPNRFPPPLLFVSCLRRNFLLICTISDDKQISLLGRLPMFFLSLHSRWVVGPFWRRRALTLGEWGLQASVQLEASQQPSFHTFPRFLTDRPTFCGNEEQVLWRCQQMFLNTVLPKIEVARKIRILKLLCSFNVFRVFSWFPKHFYAFFTVFFFSANHPEFPPNF